jgi:glucokinase
MRRMPTIGIDLGGTTIKSGRLVVPTPRTGPRAVVEAIADLVRRSGRADRVGIGTPGPLDRTHTIVTAAPNLAGFKNVPLAKMVSRATGLPVVLENDANCAGLAEYRRGAGRGARSMVYFGLGTGVGGAIVIDGRLQGACELGHITVNLDGRRCGCGLRGCVEAYASSTGLGVRDASRLFAAAKRGDRRALRRVDAAAGALGAAIGGLMHAIEPDVFVVSGGIAAAGPFLLNRVRRAARARVFASFHPRIVPGKLGVDAGWIGASLL